MNSVRIFVADNLKNIGIGICLATGATVLVWKKWFSKRKQKQRVCGVDYPKDTVIVHQFAKGDYAPSLGHFVMKLETYLRMNKIPYEPAYGFDLGGPKAKIPWIEYNGVTMGDSQLIINFLNEQFNVNLNKSLNKEQRALAWAIQKWVEEFTYHLNGYIRWCLLNEGMLKCAPTVPPKIIYYYKGFVHRMQYYIGTARHTPQEVYDMVTFDLRQLSVILGNKKFIMGGDEPTEVDCAVFGILSQVWWQTPDDCPGKQALKDEHHNLLTYLERIKQLYWPAGTIGSQEAAWPTLEIAPDDNYADDNIADDNYADGNCLMLTL